MDKPISVGDLVYVYWTHCPHESIGVPFVVEEIRSSYGAACSVCRAPLGNGPQVAGRFFAFVSQVKRIPPLDELEGKKDAADKPITLDGEIERLRKMVQA